MSAEIGGIATAVIIDSGSKYNLLSESTWMDWKKANFIVSNQRQEVDKGFKAYGGREFPILGAFPAVLKLGSASVSTDFDVIKGSGKTLVGRDTAIKLDVLRIGETINQIVTDPSGQLGMIKDVIIDIPIKADVTPVVQPYRRIPVALENAVDKKIDVTCIGCDRTSE